MTVVTRARPGPARRDSCDARSPARRSPLRADFRGRSCCRWPRTNHAGPRLGPIDDAGFVKVYERLIGKPMAEAKGKGECK
jgi:hypothetical protein